MGVDLSVWHIMASMRAVDKWSEAAQSNISNAQRVGFKQFDVTFSGGNSTIVMANPNMRTLGNQVAEQAITTGYTSIDWSQGNIVSSKGDEDFAINGQGFFMLTEQPPAAGAQLLYTRDGQFHTDAATGRLVNAQGLFVVTRADAVSMGLMAGGTSQLALALPGSLNALVYSKYGSTVFQDEPNATGLIVNEPTKSGLGELKQGFLEASNVNIERHLVGLNASKNLYQVLAKQLTVFWENFDVGLNLLK